MAEQTDKEVCSICLNDFHQPVILDCRHSFCFICFKDYVNKFSINEELLCPLCRCIIKDRDGGVQQFRPQLNTDDNSARNIPQCDVCSEYTSKFYCRDCDQYLCQSCKTTHDKLKSCKDHFVCRYDEKQICRLPNKSMKENTKATPVTNRNDLCPNHVEKQVDMYCKDCWLAVCLKCFVADHNRHNCLDIQKEQVRQSIREDLRVLNNDLEMQITNFQLDYDNLNRKLIEVKISTKTECDKVDAQVEKVCSEFHKVGENAKNRMQKTSEQEEIKIRKSMEEIKSLTEELKASVKYSKNVLEDSSIVQALQRLPKVRQEKDESCSKMYIPDVRYSKFQAPEIDATLLTNQLGKISYCKQNMVGKVVSCHQNMFEDTFLLDDVFDRWYYGKRHGVSGFTWSIGAYKLSKSLRIRLKLADTDDKRITSCKADVTYKLINITADSKSVIKQCIGTVEPVRLSECYIDVIDWSYFSNPCSGFIDDNKHFTIQVSINNVTEIKSR
ncbi:E3 ubiquitin-protein ligase TRIM33 [Patella vulgata]|uniref:E3 ubiquitin-protein ligase TRIM33 n=1 Tax=Patella vulgata TaxID=6465 RepID=UPI002180529B|nr:E3 ubiquitin-protein ligase TRIM33 [Patella vulgata]XP_050411122.1 E3 ubiquitin-protein ligase TRIM33 [Patella vulgata]